MSYIHQVNFRLFLIYIAKDINFYDYITAEVI